MVDIWSFHFKELLSASAKLPKNLTFYPNYARFRAPYHRNFQIFKIQLIYPAEKYQWTQLLLS